MKRFLAVILLVAAASAQNTIVVVPQNGGVVPPVDIVGSIQRQQQISNETKLQGAQTDLLRQQAALLRQQANALKQEAGQPSGNHSWRVKSSASNSVVIQCGEGRHAEVISDDDRATVLCVR